MPVAVTGILEINIGTALIQNSEEKTANRSRDWDGAVLLPASRPHEKSSRPDKKLVVSATERNEKSGEELAKFRKGFVRARL